MLTVWWTRVNWPNSSNKLHFMRNLVLEHLRCAIALLSVNFHKLFLWHEPRALRHSRSLALLIARQPGQQPTSQRYSLLLLDDVKLSTKYCLTAAAASWRHGNRTRQIRDFSVGKIQTQQFAIFWRENSNTVKFVLFARKIWMRRKFKYEEY